MTALAESTESRRAVGDLLPAAMLGVVVLSSALILCLLAVVLWLAFTSGSPGDPDIFGSQQYAPLLDITVPG